MKKRIPSFLGLYSLILTFAIFPGRGSAQSLLFGNEKVLFEVGVNIGPSFFMGDMGGNAGIGTRFVKDLNLEFTKVMKGAYVSVYPTDWLGFRIAAQTGIIESNDEIIDTKGEDELYRRQRNLDFKSKISEAYAAMEFYPTMLLNQYEDYEPRWRPYSLIGIGVFKFNPQGSLPGPNGTKTWHDLKPLRTEGQGMREYPQRSEYKLTQLNIPMGIGVKYFASEKVNIGLEFLYRKTFTDYLDDVSTEYIDPKYFDKYLSTEDAAIARKIHDKLYTSVTTPGILRTKPGVQRGNPKQDDAYFSMFLKFGVRLGEVYESEFARSASRRVRCRSVGF